MRIVDLTPANEQAIEEGAALLVEGFAVHWPGAWLGPEHICRAAVDAQGRVLGWIAAHAQHAGRVWELHPLVVRADRRREGIGQALVADLEARVGERDGITIILGTDDEDHVTSLSGVDLYPRVWEHIAHIRNLRGHPYAFYETCGFTIVGVIPAANGPGKPGIVMAKRVRGAPGQTRADGAGRG